MMKREFMALGKEPYKESWKPMTLSDLESMQTFLGGNIERIELPLEIDMWVNEEFLIYENEVNILLRRTVKTKYSQVIYGNVFLAATDEEGDFASLSDQQLDWVLNNTEVVNYKHPNHPVFLLDLRNGGQ